MRPDPHRRISSKDEFAYKQGEELFLNAMNIGLQKIELPPIPQRVDLPLIYIVGAPRSGTTLLYQLLSKHLDVGYVSNIMARFWARPSVGIHIANAVLGDNPDSAPVFESTQGQTPVPAGPHEFGYFWRYWLHLDKNLTHHLTKEDLSRVDKKKLTHTLRSEILGASGKSFVFKTVIAGFCARFLTELHPKSLFIHIHRNQRDIARSLLRCRKDRYGNYHTWWSLIPAAGPFKCKNPGEEVGLQTRYCCAEMTEELDTPGVSSISVNYEDICASPKTIIQQIRTALSPWGNVPAIIRNDFSSFEIHREPPLSASLEEGISKGLKVD
ncbi:sulfotransferase [Maridesulfovibrio sp.]|uniref:sulfotransferase n=1 Tax=Maridesulfovibrio sp. TaxID=2795000 RepID=UPI0029CA391F|nr:sulfotransferase [Maridesulfovibrio sp.]